MSKYMPWPFTACLFTGLAAVAQPEWPDELGDEMFHLSREVVTPHTDWASHLPGGPLRVVVIIGRLGACRRENLGGLIEPPGRFFLRTQISPGSPRKLENGDHRPLVF